MGIATVSAVAAFQCIKIGTVGMLGSASRKGCSEDGIEKKVELSRARLTPTRGDVYRV